MSQFTRAIVRPPDKNFSEGLTRVDLGKPDYHTTVAQHSAYVAALRDCGLEIITLEPNSSYPDSTFVEDTAVLTERCAVLTRPGAESRSGEVALIADELRLRFSEIRSIERPGTVDGGDICDAGDHFFIGVSRRTNDEGARQLATILGEFGYTSELIDIRSIDSILHLKSGISYICDNRMVVIDEIGDLVELEGYELLKVSQEESYAANCVRVNDRVLIAAGFPKFADQLNKLGVETIALDMSEFQKMDGGLSCLSLRF